MRVRLHNVARYGIAISLAAAALTLAHAGTLLAKPVPSAPMPEATEAFLEQGQQIYFRRCSFCHGLLGDGEGPAAEFMDPRPRDFTLGTFKFRTSQSGELPLDVDLFRTVSRGLPGTGMQAFDSDLIKNGLSEEERWAVIAYIKTFAPEFEDDELDPIKTGKVISLPANRPAFSAEVVEKGKAVFERAKCWECHGKQGRGDGQKAFDRKDDWGFPIRIRNVTHPWKIKGGATVEDIYMRFSTGINGTPMPSFVKALSEEDRWYLANFIKSLQHELSAHQVLKVHRVEGSLPEAADDPAWQAAEPMDVRLTGQVVVAPRWQNPSIELVTLKALANESEIAILAVWDDAFKDATHDDDQVFDAADISKPGAYNSYVAANDMVPRALETYRDALALQFSAKPTEGTKKPHFLRGSSSNPVNLWHWKADGNGGAGAVEEAVARGWRQQARGQAEAQQQLSGKAVWDKGRWHLVFRRPLRTEDKNDVQFVAGRFIPVSVNAWDGSNGEHGRIMSVSTWYYVFIEAGTPIRVYVFTVLAILITGALGLWLTGLARRATEGEEGV
ncbi:MAG: ethylbenzene dehydrogenase-related protein [Alphaproteobacteria bacterium]|nr:ethylbenzene dehydrogenase-related protein [Alphaproteobacteria bacterium]